MARSPTAPRFAASIASALLAGCASGPVEFLRRPAEPIQWPPPPHEARVEVEFAYGGTRDLDTHPGFLTSLLESLAGRDEVALVAPCGIAFDGHVLYVADTGAACVHRLDTATGEHRVLRGTEEVPLELPVGVAVGADHALFVADSARGRVLEFRDGQVWRRLGEGLLQRPTGLCWDAPRERLLVVDTLAACVYALHADGRELARAGTRGTALGEFNYPTHLAVAADGTIAVSDSMNFRVQLLDVELRARRVLGQVGRGPGTFASPKGVAFDPDGHLWVVDGLFENAQVFSQDGVLLLAVGAGGQDLGQFTLPTGLSIAPDGRVALADAGNSRIQILRYVSRP